MAEKYKEHKSKLSRSFKGNKDISNKIKRSRSDKHTSKKNVAEPKTPPLPVRSHSSIHDLLKERESLKKQLEKIEKQSNHDTRNIDRYSRGDKKRKYSHENMEKVYPRHRNSFKKEQKKQLYREPSPEHDYTQLDSEDEESIIEERRRKRKYLMEQLNTSDKRNNDNIKKMSIEYNKVNINNDNTKLETRSPDCASSSVDKEVTDMFSEKDDFISVSDKVTQDNNDEAHLTDNWDDLDGYYNIKVGDIINNNRYTIKNILGKGVFANVVRAQDNNQVNVNVAIKIIRNNDLMYQTGLKEIATLKEISSADPENKYHCVKLLHYFMHKGHLCLVLEPLYMDLRSVLKKYGKQNGINMKALMCYSRQLFLALRLLKKIGVIHADIKPDNILLNEKKTILKLCDFGSAAKVDDNEPTPYLVSRFYRAPEIILGVTYNYSVDTWSTGCTIYEMATGKIMFTGSSNNKMLKCFMDLKGKIPSKLIRKGKFKDQHFNYKNNFLLHSKDSITGREKNVEITNINIIRDLEKDIRKSCTNLTSNEDKKLVQLKDLLDKMLMLDPKQRLSNTDCLKHTFITDDLLL